MLRLPVVPEILGFDPRLQFMHEDDVTGALAHATLNDVPGVYNVAGDGVLPWSEVRAIVGKRRVPLPPLLTGLGGRAAAHAADRRPPARGARLLRYGRGVDNSRVQRRPGSEYRYTTPGTVDAFARGLRLENTVGARPRRTSTSATSRRSSGTPPRSCGRDDSTVPLHVERRDRVAVLTLDDPERRNALEPPSWSTRSSPRSTALEADDDVGALVVTGAPPAFCSGADVDRARVSSTPRAATPRDVRAIYDGFLAVPSSHAADGGRGERPRGRRRVQPRARAATCASPATSARASTPGSLRIGLHPGGGHTWMLERAVGPQAAAAMSLFGERVDGARAAELGLAWRCVADDELLDDAVELAARAPSVAARARRPR